MSQGASDSSTPLSAHLVEQAGAIFAVWERRAREALAGAGDTPPLVLRNYLLGFIHHIADALDAQAAGRPLPSKDYLVDADVHGRLRASVPDYDIAQVITEYRLLRQTIVEHIPPLEASTAQRDLIMQITEEHITAAASAFSQSVRELQSHITRAVSHDLRTPLTALKLSLQLASREGPAAAQHLQRALAVASRLDRITEGALDVAAFQAGQGLRVDFHQQDLREIVRQVYETASLMSAVARFELDLPDYPVTGRFSQSACERALENLLDNALKYGQRGETITISLRADETRCYLSVHNWGNPIPPDKHQRVIAAFNRSPEDADAGEVRGWGLGLSMVDAVAKAHDGRVEIESSDADGTRFTMVLPLAGPTRSSAYLIAGA